MKTALIIGATGLVGSHLLDMLIEDERFSKVRIFTRRTTGKQSEKIREFLVDFDKMAEWSQYLEGDILFSSLGTTIKKAGSQETQYKIDFTYQYETAVHAVQNGVGAFVLVSSAGASPASKVFYSRMKGELEDAVCKLDFQKIRIIRPGILDGPRIESRPMEKAAIRFSRIFSYIPGIKQFRPIHANIVATAMINAALDEAGGIKKYTLAGVFDLGGG